MSHHTDPAALLLLARDLGRVPPDVYVVSIPAGNLELGFELSTETAKGVEEAVDTITEIASRAFGP
jgi:Ni,Fe-hydrogenase maturation factor